MISPTLYPAGWVRERVSDQEQLRSSPRDACVTGTAIGRARKGFLPAIGSDFLIAAFRNRCMYLKGEVTAKILYLLAYSLNAPTARTVLG